MRVVNEVCLLHFLADSFSTDLLIKLSSQDHDLFWSLEAETDFIPINAGNGENDVITDHNGFANFPCKNEHIGCFCGVWVDFEVSDYRAGGSRMMRLEKLKG